MNTNESILKDRLTALLGQNSETINFIEELSTTGDLLFFGGAVRDLCLNPTSKKLPRDFDIAINFNDRDRFHDIIVNYDHKRNRFGGYKFIISTVDFDVWDLNNTWAFKNKYLIPSEENLARSVYLNIDGIVYNFNRNRLYDDIFKSSIMSSQIDITLEENPQVELNLLRALVFKYKYDLGFSKKLKDVFKTLVSRQEDRLIEDLYNIQFSHYKNCAFSKEDLKRELQCI
ncbi:hypothetical protein MO973_00060 [Paenibacillus sp. TRM 82003]|nr:hypothetical protein [Paenibacillus sp. TRM 82003]